MRKIVFVSTLTTNQNAAARRAFLFPAGFIRLIFERGKGKERNVKEPPFKGMISI